MLYKKINVELIVVADEAEAVTVELNAALDRLEERHTLFGGGIEVVAFEHSGTRRKSALAHTMAAGETVVDPAIAKKAPYTMYTGSQYLLRSPDRGVTWEKASPDLTGAVAAGGAVAAVVPGAHRRGDRRGIGEP